MIIVLSIVFFLFFALLFFALKSGKDVRAGCKLPFVDLSLEAKQPSERDR